MRIVFATGNQHKLEEIRAILPPPGFEILSMKEAGVSAEIVEDGKTFEENALIKARAVSKLTGEITMADDSGLVVDALGGAPGIYSSRWMGEDTSYRVKNAEIIKRLSGLTGKERSARFICAIACVFPDGRELTAEGVYEGQIGYEEKGSNGFGYDPIFYVPEKGRYSAELSPEEKNAISHRGSALRAMRDRLRGEL
ncbi:MAG: RdgB/HAM1 family non-canonical purine NTP pyrophosphatase [Lachnospiraceae bacterium]|nr:RdgB/HAM1 family non-canonical purine NTP pyrophosphatase [Lachnospiraceae bacterium]